MKEMQMSNVKTMKKPQRWTRDTMQGRRHIINEARMPDHFTRATGQSRERRHIRRSCSTSVPGTRVSGYS
jgi:hypothetical protein